MEQLRSNHLYHDIYCTPLSNTPYGSVCSAIYKILFRHCHKENATYKRVAEVYATRWCHTNLLPRGRATQLASEAVKQLRWISRRVPPNVHNANIRFHLNGFHTARRYQQSKPCIFCKSADSEDSIEHIIVCPRVSTCINVDWKPYGHAVPPPYWYLLEGDGKTRLSMACFVFAVYTVHNNIRHSGDTHDLHKQIYMALNLPSLAKPLRKAWEDMFHFRQSRF